MTRLRIGVFGAGLIAQIVHLPALRQLADRFEIAGVADPSAKARRFVAERFGVAVFPTYEELLGAPLDAVLIATPDFLHAEAVGIALEAGLHVLVEKPLCYGAPAAERLIAARERAGRVVQVGYMKRFDLAFEAALREVAGRGAALRHVIVEKNEPRDEYHMSHHAFVASDDLAAGLLAAGRAAAREQVETALGLTLGDAAYRAFVGPLCSSLVHDVNAVLGLLEAMRLEDVRPVAAEAFAGGACAAATLRLDGGRALWQMTHIAVPSLAEYRERIALFFDDGILELVFPSPYVDHLPTRLILQSSQGHRYERAERRLGFAHSYQRQLLGFWSAVVEGGEVRSTLEHARRDMTLLTGIGRLLRDG